MLLIFFNAFLFSIYIVISFENSWHIFTMSVKKDVENPISKTPTDRQIGIINSCKIVGAHQK